MTPKERLAAIADRVGELFKREAGWLRVEAVTTKLVLIVLGGAAAGAAQFIGTPPAGSPDWPKILGLGGVGAMFLGGVLGTLRERTTAEALEDARQAIDQARQAQGEHFQITQYVTEMEDKLRRMSHLHIAHLSMREAVEQCFSLPSKDEAKAAEIVLSAATTVIRPAIDFQMDEAWTLSIYQARRDSHGQIELACVAADRFDQRPASGTRVWPVGVGHTGSTYAKGDETVVPDLAALQLGTLDRLPSRFSHPTDSQRYRSIAAIPVRVLNDPELWGVVVATSDRPSRFALEHDEKGSLSAEVVRAVAGIVGLAVATQR